MESTCRYRMVSLGGARRSPYINSSRNRHASRKDCPASGQIEATDGQIDALVYELYALTEEEIGIVVAASG